MAKPKPPRKAMKVCWQCYKPMIRDAKRKIWTCPNNCGPQALAKLFRLGRG